MRNETLLNVTGDIIIDSMLLVIVVAAPFLFGSLVNALRARFISRMLDEIEHGTCGYAYDQRKRWKEKIRRLKKINFNVWDKEHVENTILLWILLKMINYAAIWEVYSRYERMLSTYERKLAS